METRRWKNDDDCTFIKDLKQTEEALESGKVLSKRAK
jgi:hypothetical protein